MAADLTSIDVAEAWKPVEGLDWNVKWAAHLFRRAAFGYPPLGFFPSPSSWTALEYAVKQGMEACVDQLVEGGLGHVPFNKMMDRSGRETAGTKDLERLQGWWLYRMMFTPHPLEERMTLFWHDHFATSNAKIKDLSLMLDQNKLLRKHSLGSFRTMLNDIGRNAAMILWLDSNSNVKGKPNENYAREIMELFTLGVGNYTEEDIKEVARSFTGYDTHDGKFYFEADEHDVGEKTVFGQTGKWGGDDVVRILLEQPAAARFIVRKLFHEFVNDYQAPPDDLIEPLAKQFRESDYDIKVPLRTIFRSRLFYSDAAYRSRVKSPVEYILGIVNAFYAVVPMQELAASMDGMGQALFAPPNVKGWDGGKVWLNSSTLLARHNIAWRLVGGGSNLLEKRIDPSKLVSNHGKKKPQEQIEFLLDLLLQGDASKAAKQKLIALAKFGGLPKNQQKKQLRELTHNILLLPEYQLC
ncbi:MAG: DUF1800 domain-containing protein [Planctomycetes bacterium]|nr:DUF1800 domain-containing protein [Planctomycetota bacterium]